MAPPGGQLPTGFLERSEPFHIRTLISQPAVEAFNESVLHWPPRPDENQLHPVLQCPGFQGPSRELAAVIAGDALRSPTRSQDRLIQSRNHFLPTHGTVGNQKHALPRELVHSRQNPIGSTIGQLIAHKIHAPTLV